MVRADPEFAWHADGRGPFRDIGYERLGQGFGGVAGFALGGPLGAIVGAIAGHAIDRARAARAGAGSAGSTDAKRVAFTAAVVVLGAKMAKADGFVSAEEIRAFKQVFHIPPEHMADVARLFNKAKQAADGYEPYAEQVAAMFADSPAVLEELLHALFTIAKADGVIHPKEREFVDRVGTIFGFSADQMRRIRAGEQDGAVDAANSYAVLGLSPKTSDAAVKAARRKLIRENHPDKLIAEGMPQEFVDLATEKMATINAAYDRIARDRGLT